MTAKCYLCLGENLKLIRDRLRHNIKRNVWQCLGCGLVFLEPGQENLKEFYTEDYRKLHSPVVGKALSAKEIFDIYLPFQQNRLNEIQHLLNPKKKVLDIGCSTGHFLYSIKKCVGEVVGVELNQEHADFCNNNLGIKVYTQPIEEVNLPKGYFDLVSILQTLEHIENPVSFLRKVGEFLKPDGTLYLEVPNVDDALRTIFGISAFDDFDFRQPHLFYFSKNTLSSIAGKAGFEGVVKGTAYPNIINQLHWIFLQKPQNSASDMFGDIRLPFAADVPGETKSEFLSLFRKFNKEYRQLLKNNFLGHAILFLGKKRLRA